MQFRLLFSLLLSWVATIGLAQTSIGIIGTATPGGWDADTDLIQDSGDPAKWSLVLNLNVGEAKFRQDNAWDINWGNTAFPIGTGVQGGANIPIPVAGEYTIKFNSSTGDYNFSIKSDIGIIGSATPGGWNEDTNMFPDPNNADTYSITLNLVQGEAKFRKDDNWTVNWGAADFPAGTGTQGGPNIPIATASKYKIDFNKATGAYTFTEIAEYTAIGVIGTATPGGWDSDTDLNRDSGNPSLWKKVVSLTIGEMKIRANDGWTYNWGGTDFPIGTAVPNGNNIAVPEAGDYLASFNTTTLEYKFLLVGNYSTVGIIGSATPGGWSEDTDMDQDPNDKSVWRKRLILVDGEAKFRADNAWTVNWGAGDFPTGVAEQDGANIPVPAGEYLITFNSTTGEYEFEKLVVYSTIGLIGPATPIGNWNTDVDMTKDANDESFWFLSSVDLVDGEAKFRAEDAWAVNWGLAQWPSGIGVQDGANIPITGGTYRVTLNSATGDYAFSPPSGTINPLLNNHVAIVPNPAKEVINLNVAAPELLGNANIILFDQNGRRVLEKNMNIQEVSTIQIPGVPPGNYTLHLNNGKFIVGKKVIIVK
jgi:hypothetical protein